MTGWIPAFDVGELPRGAARTLTHRDDHVAIFHADDGFFAVDARCPHEGYPLAKGDVDGCTLTCIWHNYQFDLRDGRCLVGEEAVRTYPLRVVDGRIEIDVTPPPRDGAEAALWTSLDGAIGRRRIGQAARDVVRLLQLGVAPARIALAAARFDARHGEYGTGHALPVAADLVAIAARRPALALMPAIEMAAESAHHPVRAVAAGSAEAALRDRLAAGASRAELEPELLELASRHFVDFGHTLIYLVKAFELLDHVGWAHAIEILPAWRYGLEMGTREDLLPEWHWFRERAAAPPAAPLPADLAGTITDGTREAAFDAVTAAIAAGVPRDRILDAIVLGAAQRLLRFDPALDPDPTIQEDWLSVTHVLTYANAARRTSDPRPLQFAARFVNVSRALDGAPASIAPEPGDVIAAVARRDPAAAVRHAAAAPDPGALCDALEDWCLTRGATRPIFLAHQVKTLRAARAEVARVGITPLLGTVRFLAAPVQERGAPQAVHEAERFLLEGKVPRKLT
jgi:nitrite reductase/ring-hydroxylating ferredoxin subunit